MTVLLGVVGMIAMLFVGIIIGRRQALGASYRIPAVNATESYLRYVRNQAIGSLDPSDLARFNNGDESVVTDAMNAIMDDSIDGHRKLRLGLEAASGRVRKQEIESQMYEKINPQVAAACESTKVIFQEQADGIQDHLDHIYAYHWKQLSPELRASTLAL